MPTLEAALMYLGIDYADDMVTENVERALNSAWHTVLSAVGEDAPTYLANDPRLEELTLIYLDALYSERGVSAKALGATRSLLSGMELQLRMELRRAKEEAADGVRQACHPTGAGCAV